MSVSLDSKENPSVISSLLCGGVSGLASRFVISPLDVIKIRIQIENTRFISSSKEKHKAHPLKYRGMFGTAKTILTEEGLHAFWKGNMSAQYLYIAYSATQFFSYQQITEALGSLSTTSSLPLRSFISGASAGFIATALTYPLDLLRTKFVAQDDSKKIYLGVRQALGLVVKREGFGGLYKGLSPTLLQIMPAMGVAFFSYEYIKTAFGWYLNEESFLNPWKDTLAGATAGLLSKTAVFPMDVIRKRFQVQTEVATISPAFHLAKYREARGTWDMLSRLIKHEGWQALYKGLAPGLVKSIPSSAVTFGVYGLCMRCLNPTFE